jgi:PPOX class probable F420-dependent enzyme
VASLADGWARLSRARVATLGTIGPDGFTHLVPCCFAVEGTVLYSAVDDKPKISPRLRRLDNVSADERVTLLVDHYDEEWERLWWIRASGTARVLPSVAADQPSEHDRAVRLLLAKYTQYATHRLDGPVLAVTLSRWRTWTWDGKNPKKA